MPTYNRDRIIDKSIKSILRQSFKDYELIIIDASSTDNTKERVTKYRDPRIIYLKRHYNRITSRNHSLKIARGEYIAYCDDDCIYYPNHLQESVSFLDRHPGIGMVYTDGLICMPGEKPFRIKLDFDRHRLEGHSFFLLPTVMQRKKCLKKTGNFDERLKNSEDWDMWLRISDFYSIKHLPVVTLKHAYYNNIPSTSSTPNRGLHVEYIIRKRTAKAQKEGRILNYINDCSIGLIKNLIDNRNITYAVQLTADFYQTVKNYQTLACLGLCNFGKGDFHKAEILFQNSLNKLPRDWQKLDPWYQENILTIKVNLARVNHNLGKLKQAINICQDVLKLMPTNLEAKVELARCFIEQGLYNKAQNILKGCGFNPAVYNLRGYAYFKMKKYKQAIQEFKNALILEPNIALYHYNLATVYAIMKEYLKAKVEYKKVIQLEPNHPKAYQMLKRLNRK